MLELPVDRAALTFLFWGEVLPDFHSSEHALLLLWRQARENPQLPQHLRLPRRRKSSELRITLE